MIRFLKYGLITSSNVIASSYLPVCRQAWLAITVMVMLSANVQAQYTSNLGRFETDQVKGCVGLVVNITILEPSCDCSASCPCDFDYDGDGNYEVKASPFQYTFNTPGNYRLIVLFPSLGQDFIDITVTSKGAPTFNINSCAGESVELDITNTQYDNYVIDYGDGTIITIPNNAPDPQHSYPDNTLRTVQVRGLDNNAADNCATTSNDVIPVNTIPTPTLTSLVMLNATSLSLNYTANPNIDYDLQISPNGTNFSFLKKLDESTSSTTINGLALLNNYYCFRIAAYDACTGIIVAFSNVICSIDLDVSYDNDENNLSWRTQNPNINFTICANGDCSLGVPAANRSFKDINVTCNTDYCYTLIANYAGGGTSTSLEICGSAFSTIPPDPIENISTVVASSESITLSWQPPTGTTIANYEVQRGNGSIFTTIANTDIPTYEDTGLNTTETSYCYRILATDICGNTNNQSITACSLLLKGTIAGDNTITLEWNTYTGWTNGTTNYTVTKNYPTSAPVTSNAGSNSFSEIDNNDSEQVLQYVITANPTDALPVSSSNAYTLVKPSRIFFPTAFTPNGDGENDRFTLGGKYIVDFELQIYNRWGELMFSTTDMSEGWDGTFSGKVLPEGTYAFRATLHDQAGRETVKTGTILLLRK